RATRFLRNDGDGAFSDVSDDSFPEQLSSPGFGLGDMLQATSAALGDVDGDENIDIVLTSGFPVRRTSVTATSVSGGVTRLEQSGDFVSATRVLTGDSQGNFDMLEDAFAEPFISVYSGRPALDFGGSDNALGDLDGDGDLDLVVTRERPTAYVYAAEDGYDYYMIVAAQILLNDGNGAFEHDESALPDPPGDKAAANSEFWQATAVRLLDVDQDEDLDLLLGRRFAIAWQDPVTNQWKLRPALMVLTNDGDGVFTEATEMVLPGTLAVGGGVDTLVSVCDIAIGDLDGDGFDDLVVTGLTGLVEEFGDSGFGEFGLRPTSARSATRVLLADGEGAFRDATSSWIREGEGIDSLPGRALALGDLDGDDDLDIVIGYDAESYDDPVPGSRRPLRVLLNR
ncbi:MAG: hypothetical protein ACYTG4_14535, partial [Planctomycetota bacterium]